MSDKEMTRGEYWSEVDEIADSILDEVLSESADDGEDNEDEIRERMEERLWETIDGHQWVIYTAYNWDVLRFSPNDGYSIEEFGADGIVEDGELQTGRLAFGALYADVSDKLWDRFSERMAEADEDE